MAICAGRNNVDAEERQSINMQGIKEELRDKFAERLRQLLDSSSSNNSL